MKEHNYYVYILTNQRNNVMYVGITNDLRRLLLEHRNKAIKGFTDKYNVYKLVYYENTTFIHTALEREKEIKKWRREKKNVLVESNNPDWTDLGVELFV